MSIGENNDKAGFTRRTRSIRRVMHAPFFDSDGTVAQVTIPERCRVISTFYKENVLSTVLDHFTTKRTRTGTCGIELLYDNAPTNLSAVVKEYLKKIYIIFLPHAMIFLLVTFGRTTLY